VVLNANNQSGIFVMQLAGAIVNLTGVTLTGSNGAAIYTTVPMALNGCTFTGNQGTNGAAIYSYQNSISSVVSVTNCTFSGNTATSRGGALNNQAGRLVIESTTISGNTAPAGGGGGIFSESQNSVSTEVRNSIIAGNAGSDVAYAMITVMPYHSGGYNVIGNGNVTSRFDRTGDQVIGTASPGLGPLQENGGKTQTRALLSGSPALDRGSASVAVDQVGQPRPFDNPDVANAANGSDVGAYEAQTRLDPVGAASLVVSTTADVVAQDGFVSLREAIASASSGSTIVSRPRSRGRRSRCRLWVTAHSARARCS
jgi:predicted outer membrane repeat protein